uniref:Uncharacterized protein n=1 Tax=Picea glauca TaxID=3330 RepID=A0A101LU15_PICGL|nr:hypothetical protein ABT39_MTgene3412 [Picea glauca]QHR86877.1 hypothetical protein Q903MT_gene884 [Picea sitchensis]
MAQGQYQAEGRGNQWFEVEGSVVGLLSLGHLFLLLGKRVTCVT